MLPPIGQIRLFLLLDDCAGQTRTTTLKAKSNMRRIFFLRSAASPETPCFIPGKGRNAHVCCYQRAPPLAAEGFPPFVTSLIYSAKFTIN